MNNKPKELDVVAEINRLHRECCAGMRTTLVKAIEIGKRLADQKEKCGHGKWEAWVETNLAFSVSLAWRYMQCHANRANLASMQDLTIAEFAKLTDQPKPEPAQEEQNINPEKLKHAKSVLRNNPKMSIRKLQKEAKVTFWAAKAAKDQLVTAGEIEDFRPPHANRPKTIAAVVEPTPKPATPKETQARELLLKTFKTFYAKHAGAMIESSRMPALIKDFHKMCSLGTLEEVEAAWLQFKPTVCSDTFIIRI